MSNDIYRKGMFSVMGISKRKLIVIYLVVKLMVFALLLNGGIL